MTVLQRRICCLLFCYLSVTNIALHSFPTRRSSDLSGNVTVIRSVSSRPAALRRSLSARIRSSTRPDSGTQRPAQGGRPGARSEEHTSELQSLTNLVCRLLLEKKKTTKHCTCTPSYS